MNFVNYRNYVKSVNNYPNMFFPLNMTNRDSGINTPNVLPNPNPVVSNRAVQYVNPYYPQHQSYETIETPKKIKWGYPTWLLFHTMSVKIKDELVDSYIDNVMRTIYIICINLPCPDCANHAKTYLDSINLINIRTKYQLQRMLFDFHNSVNARKGYPMFDFSNLEETYSRAITRNVIVNFIDNFKDKSRSIKMIANDFHRARLVNELTDWFNKNIEIFEP